MTSHLPLWAERIAVFDTETTGVDPREARIVTAAIALLNRDGEIAERYDWLLDPGVEIPLPAVQVHGISTDVARTSGIHAEVGIAQIVERVTEMLARGFPIVAYNAPFDLSLLLAEAHRYGIAWPETIAPVIDPLILDKQFDRFRRGKRTLTAVAAHYGVDIGQAHDAGDDAIAAGRVLHRLTEKFVDVIPADLDELHRRQVEWARDQAENFQAYMRRTKNPSFVAEGGWPLR